ncbi:hypothetical protein Gasu2_42850 [Galdieria sulphuraria]|uniref:Phosphoglycolate phosphatase n=1 Tax=Galdieria sulphuraria TaxID=130081 RepID=M2X7W9_GALSU|nr:uncharacterized protein Gasu_00220 [Galdieria sulphuraria]EME32650.1 hypothetical protein Gasu_00220 [Galdieria sulphuraria]GJD10068.1 hypothetical protein Gasu2_42850 [Galdieria sulphuraria]|eukprot:XP_005709170.1 hypothetical protein Gasu_00220 [Galdieria sulphuraria]
MLKSHRCVSKRILVTFDIDGTLLKGGKNANTGHKRSIEWAVSQVWGIQTSVEGVKHGGLTDPIIIQNMLLQCGKTEQEIWQKMNLAVQLATEHFEKTYSDSETVTVLPGVRTLLESLKQRGVYLAVVSGNLETIGWKKIERAQLKPFFMTGAFGSDHICRGELILLAKQRIMQQCGSTGDEIPWEVYHVGDTLEDMEAAQYAQVKGIGVLTGSCSQAHILSSAEPYLIIPDLMKGAELFMARLGFE